MKTLLTKEEFYNKSNKCKFEHINEDQHSCYSCDNNIDEINKGNCPKIKKAWKKYKRKYSINDAIYIIMQVQ